MFVKQDTTSTRAIASALRDADAAIARAIDLLGRTDIEAETGVSSELFLTLEAGCTGTDARVLANAAAALRAMPFTKAAFDLGKLSWGQVRAIVSSVRFVSAAHRGVIDTLVYEHAGRGGDPDRLLATVDDRRRTITREVVAYDYGLSLIFHHLSLSPPQHSRSPRYAVGGRPPGRL